MAEDWDADPAFSNEVVSSGPGGFSSIPASAELPEIKLFGRWSCDDVQVSDISLQVILTCSRSWYIK